MRAALGTTRIDSVATNIEPHIMKLWAFILLLSLVALASALRTYLIHLLGSKSMFPRGKNGGDMKLTVLLCWCWV